MSATRFIFVSLIVYALLQMLHPLSMRYPVDPYSAFVMLAYSVALLLGAFLGDVRHAGSVRPIVETRGPAFVYIVAGVGTVGVALRLFDLFVLRGGQFGGSQELKIVQLQVATSSSGTGAGGVSGAAALLSSFSIFGLVAYRYYRDQISRRLGLYLLAISFFSPFEGVFARGGIFNVGFFGVFAMMVFWEDQDLRRSVIGRFVANRVAVILAGIAFVLVGGTMFRGRVELMYGSIQNFQALAGSAAMLQQPDWLLEASREPVWGIVAFPAAWIVDYLFQGFAELNFVLANFSAEFHTWGASQFEHLMRLWGLFAGPANVSLEHVNPRAGRYVTFYANVYFDFGLLGGTIQMALMGYFTAVTRAWRLAGHLGGQIFEPLMRAFLIVGFLVNGLPSARGFFPIAACIIMGTLFIFNGQGNAARSADQGASSFSRGVGRKAQGA